MKDRLGYSYQKQSSFLLAARHYNLHQYTLIKEKPAQMEHNPIYNNSIVLKMEYSSWSKSTNIYTVITARETYVHLTTYSNGSQIF